MRNKLLWVGIIASLAACRDHGPRAIVTDGDSARGRVAIAYYGCGSCHTIKGIGNAHGLVGPPLVGLRDRIYVAGMLANSPANLTRWIQDPKSVNERTAMPKLGVTGPEATDIAAYLYAPQ